MAESPTLLPALPLKLQIQGLAALGLDPARVHARVGVLPEGPDATVPVRAYLDMWDEAQALYGLPGLPTALAMAIPFGAFGALDYLAGSADTIAGCCESARLHFAMVAKDVWLELDDLADGTHALRVRGVPELPVQALEFTLAAIVGRLRHVGGAGFGPRLVGLPVPRAQDEALRTRLLGIAPTFDFPCAEMHIDDAQWASATQGGDPLLHATLRDLAAQLRLARPDDSSLEQALRARLRGALAQGRADAARLALLLGVSERTLQRRLADIGRSFSDVVEDFRREEAMRLLAMPDTRLAEIAAQLGYAEQTSFTRAFRRWTGATPGAWRAARRV